MKTVNILIGLTAGTILAAALGSWINFSKPSSLEGNISVSQESYREEKVFLLVDGGQGGLENFEALPREKMTAFDLLKKMAEESGMGLETKNYEFGILVESIGERVNGEEGKYWIYYVNGEMPNVSADKKEIKSGDKIEFKFEKPSF